MHPEEQLSAYMDGELEEDARLEIEAHLERCPSCRMLLMELTEMTRSFTAEMLALAEPPGLENRVMRAVARENRIRGLGRLWLLVPLLAALAFVLLAVVAGPVAVHVMRGALAVGKALLYTTSHAVSDMPVLAAAAAVLSLSVLAASILSLRRLLRSAAV
ncbi:zf-HC2 domain-containing protein [Paenibacillus sp. MWE-103]|uniref:Anti-sigma-W factor RsiW n=1 Tax=Paenibacillus artemisiicola TaxID=1172618 RepID=A0ABS3W449_9BACL|nr:zf-HC2 domain-containing protein [Paenibacillus artemisiicola]MBO7743067.1 zf-HC2 domain-containing protein [Paenibacillus artemisiicola]